MQDETENIRANSSAGTVKAILAGAGVAIVAGLAWSWIAALTGYEIGYVAVVIGVGVGGAVRHFTAKRSFGMGVLSAVLAVTGIFLGKLCMFEAELAPDAPAGYYIVHQEAVAYGFTKDEHLIMYILGAKIDNGELSDAFGKLDSEQVDYATGVKELKANWKTATAAFEALSEAEKKEMRENLTENCLLTWYVQRAAAEGKLKQTITLEQLGEIAERGDEKALAEAAGKYSAENVKNAEFAQLMLDKMSAGEKSALIREMKSDYAKAGAELRSEVRREVFKGLFNIKDITFFAIALVAAYSLARNEKIGKK